MTIYLKYVKFKWEVGIYCLCGGDTDAHLKSVQVPQKRKGEFSMKKRLCFIAVSIIAVCVSCLIGFKSIPLIKSDTDKTDTEPVVEATTEEGVENIIETETATGNTTLKPVDLTVEKSADAKSETAAQAPVAESAEDKSVKEEITKYVDADKKLKYNMQETVNGKVFNLNFSKIDNTLKGQETAIYNDNSGNEFEFDLKTGKLYIARMNSLITAKNAQSIDSAAAQTVAENYIATKCDMQNYTLESFKEVQKGYYSYIYTKYIAGYPSSEKFSVGVGYDGSIVYARDSSYVFEGKNTDITKDYVDSKIKEKTNENDVDWDSVTVTLDGNGKLAVKYTVPSINGIAILVIE